MAAQMLKEGAPPGPMTPDTWTDALKENARSFRDSLLRYRDGARVHAGTRPDSSLYASLDDRVRAMRDAGFSADDAVRAMMVMSHYVVGSVIEEQSGADAARVSIESGFLPDADTYPDLFCGISQMHDDDATDGFEFGLDALVRGLATTRSA
jgi:TetR/AcrR family tetracycline transcriptional repressor